MTANEQMLHYVLRFYDICAALLTEWYLAGHVPTAASFATENAPKCTISKVKFLPVAKSSISHRFQLQIPSCLLTLQKNDVSLLDLHETKFWETRPLPGDLRHCIDCKPR